MYFKLKMKKQSRCCIKACQNLIVIPDFNLNVRGVKAKKGAVVVSQCLLQLINAMYNIFDTSYGTHVVSSFYDIYDSTWKTRSAFKNIQTSINNLVTKGCLHCFYLAFVSGGNFCVHIFCLLGQTNTLRLPPIFLALKIFIIYHWVYKSRKTLIVYCNPYIR